jgi:hypothetical protein
MGLDLTRLDEITEEEKDAFKARFLEVTGRLHPGQIFWLDDRPDILKRYRNWSDKINAFGGFKPYNPNGFGFVYLYGITGWVEGVKYIVHVEQVHGLSEAQVLEGIAAAFIWLGPRGMETVHDALDGYEWKESQADPVFPDNWAPDPDGFASGLDFENPDLSDEELESLRDWYMRVEGEVPAYVGFLSQHGRQVLKAYRNRFETALTTLPKQVMPYLMIHIDVMRGSREGIREGVLLARGFGMTKLQTLEAISWGMFYGGVESGSIVAHAAGDILDSWGD